MKKHVDEKKLRKVVIYIVGINGENKYTAENF